MIAKSSPGLHSSAARRPAMWPWLVMPLAVLALFALLHTVRQSGVESGPDTDSALTGTAP